MQNTGGSWEGIPLMLETMNPAFRLRSPKLPHWNVGIFGPPPIIAEVPMTGVPMTGTPITRHSDQYLALDHEVALQGEGIGPEAEPSHRIHDTDNLQIMSRVQIVSSNKGNIAATFEVPGFIDIPSEWP
ncbi:hypothetical protein BDN70DRAFT_940014 [Pholiota conissans]|uniref:DUF4139 domain-containing protein n=1 Tax=Pholiota conissans TaxID=109636 RepID=A0A9P5YJY5_9AGAR|nr:hypothetical protein BDN70DRAFT_940014 [Pholiota conissans]